jgi:hypothetical protein
LKEEGRSCRGKYPVMGVMVYGEASHDLGVQVLEEVRKRRKIHIAIAKVP